MSAHLIRRGEGGVPVYRQIAQMLRREIQDYYKAGDAMPAEADLALRFSVNRHTLRRAIDELVADGSVTRVHGKGIFVLEPTINYSIGQRTRFTETLENQGKVTSSRVIRKQVVPARGGVALRLQLSEGADVLFLETLRAVDGKPLCVISHFLPLARFPFILDRYEQGSLHHFMERSCSISLKRSESLISAVLPEVGDAILLNMPRNTPVLRVKSVNLDAASSQPVEYSVTRFRGDAVQLSVQPLQPSNH